MRPYNVLHLRDTYEVGGPGKTILETHRAIDAARFRLHLGVFQAARESGDSPFMTAAKEYGMPVHAVCGANGYDPRLVCRVVEMVRRLDIDLLHAHEASSDLITYLASRLHRLPIVTTLHGWIGNTPKQRAFIALDKWVVTKFDRVIAVSGVIRDQIAAAGVTTGRLRLLHNAIVLERYRRTGRQRAIEQAVGCPVTRPVLVSIGRISPEKGHADLVDALAILAARGCRVSAVIVGDGPARAALQSKIDALGLRGSIHLPGYLSEPQAILEDTDLMVLPSHTEGLPNAALEALAMGVPVLATRVGGTPEVLTDGETGRLVPPHAPEALAAGIMEFLQNREAWQQMAVRGRAVVESQFDFRARTRRLEEIYTELMEGGQL